MASSNSSRPARPRGRKGGNLVRTHPSPTVATELEQIRTQLELVATAAEKAAGDLDEQNADIDTDVAHLLREAVVNVLMRQVDRLCALLGDGSGGAS